MSIISISGGIYSGCSEIASQVAQKLGYTYLNRDVIFTTPEELDIPTFLDVTASDDPTAFYDDPKARKPHTVACLKSILLTYVRIDDVVYDGPAGQFLLQNIKQALKVRVIADFPDRIAAAMADKGLSEDDAAKFVTKFDEARSGWAHAALGMAPEDDTLYDLAVHAGRLGIDSAVDMIGHMVSQEAFRSTPESKADLDNLILSTYIETLISELEPSQSDAEVIAGDGMVHVRLKRLPRIKAGTSPEFRTYYAQDMQRRLLERCFRLSGLKSIEVSVAAV